MNIRSALVGLLAVLVSVAAAEPREEREMRDLIHLTPSELPMMSAPVRTVSLVPGRFVTRGASRDLPLDGIWSLARDGSEKDRLRGDWKDACPAQVPGSIHTALMNAGRLPDPYFGVNALEARLMSTEHDWWYTVSFDFHGREEKAELVFDGVCDRARVFLNGVLLGSHTGMFGGPVFDITDYVKEGKNDLVVFLARATDWHETAVFNCTYGWHYSQIIPLGIWNHVRLRRCPVVRFEEPPFIATADAAKGRMNLLVRLAGEGRLRGTLKGTVTGANFDTAPLSFVTSVTSAVTRLDFTIPAPRLWWPNGHGAQNLYRLDLAFESEKGTPVFETIRFGVRSLHFHPTPVNPSSYSRLVVLNGRPLFLKGANWCTIDALMRFTRADYDRILRRAKEQGLNWLRAWGGGLVETDAFYDLCDEYGITVMQEWPSCWNSHLRQPRDVLRETVIRNTRRLRNHPSLILWCGGNEGRIKDTDPVMYSIIGRETYVNDGTRLFFSQDDYTSGDSTVTHHHIRWTRAYPEEYFVKFADRALGLHEYGLDSLPDPAQLARYLPPNELTSWPINPDGALAYHTATFNGYGQHGKVRHSSLYAKIGMPAQTYPDRYIGPVTNAWDIKAYLFQSRPFLNDDRLASVSDLALGSQLAQTMAVAPIIANQRASFPRISSLAYYKLNDVTPGGSWAVVDWFGAPKIAYWFVRRAFRPVIGVLKLPSLEPCVDGRVCAWPVHLLDDAGDLTGKEWRVTAELYDAALSKVASQTFKGSGAPLGGNGRLGALAFPASRMGNSVAFAVAETDIGGRVIERIFTPLNYGKIRGSLFTLPRTPLIVRRFAAREVITITNAGTVPAVAVQVACEGHTASFYPSDNYFWLAPGETREISCRFSDGRNRIDIVRVSCWNALSSLEY